MIKIKRNIDSIWIESEEISEKENKSRYKCTLLTGQEFSFLLEDMRDNSSNNAIKISALRMEKLLNDHVVDWENVEIDGSKNFDKEAVTLLPSTIKSTLCSTIINSSFLADEEKKI